MRSFVSGVIWGGIVAVLGLGVVSELAPLPRKAVDTKTAMTSANSPEKPSSATPEVAPAVPPVVPPAAEEATPAPVTPVQDDVASAPAPATPEATVPAMPQIATPSVPPAPAAAEDSPAALVTSPDAPSLSTDANEATAVTPPADPVTEGSTPDAPPLASGDALPNAPDLPPVPPMTDAEMALALAEAGVVLDTPDAAPKTAPDTARDTSLPAETTHDGLPDSALLPDTDNLPAVDPTEDPAIAASETAEPAAPAEPLLDAPAVPTPSRPKAGFTEAAGVTTGRLPTITPAAPDGSEDPAAIVVADPAADTPLRRFAAEFTNPSAKPLFTIILIDGGEPKLNRVALAEIPMPVTFAIDPSLPDAEKIAAIYRAAGKEVVMLATGLPQGAKASDIEVTFQANAAALPEATAVLDLETGGFQGDRPLSSMVVPVIKGQGRGLITWDRGLNAATQVAQREDVPRGLVFRRLDGEGESIPTMRRYLDRAAFKAAQDGRVAVVGSTAADTISALMEWSVEGRAASVALAPASALLSTD